MKLIFLDIDGVLADETRHDNKYRRISLEAVFQFNRLLHAAPDAHVVISSSWRYLVHGETMTVVGFTNLLLSHGVNCHGRIVGITESDEETCGGKQTYEYLSANAAHIRRAQIAKYAHKAEATDWVILDDMDLHSRRQVLTRPDIGLTERDVQEALEILGILRT